MLSQKYRRLVKSVWIWKTWYVISEIQALSEKCLDLEDLVCSHEKYRRSVKSVGSEISNMFTLMHLGTRNYCTL